MPFDFIERKRNRSADETRRIYVCEGGDICMETKHSRQNFSPEEFIDLLRTISIKKTNHHSDRREKDFE